MLLGRDHTEYGKTAIERVGPVAIALSRGRYPKAYPHTDPNEDAIVAAVDDETVVMAVADGHRGIQASHLVAETLFRSIPELVRLPPSEAVVEAVGEAAAALGSAAPTSIQPRSATTLTVVATRANAGAAAGWGDSAAAHLRGREADPLLRQKAEFVAIGESLAEPVSPVTFRLAAGDWVLLATDGLTDFVLRPWPKTLAAKLQPRHRPDQVVEAAVS